MECVTLVEISVVVPVFNSEECVDELYRRISTTLGSLDVSYEIVLVDDSSPDGSWNRIAQIARRDVAVKGFRLSRNFGQHAAITAGLSHATGRWAVVMDCDLQDPPEDIPRLYAEAHKGCDIVLAKRSGRRHSAFRRLAARAYFRTLSLFNRAPFQHEYGSFSLISRRVIDAFLAVPDRDRHYLLILYWLGFTVRSIEYEHGDRLAGGSTYTLRKLLRHAVEGVFFQTTVFLRWIVYLGLGLSLLGFLYAGWLVMRYLFWSAFPGWTSLAVLILVIGGVVTASIGIVGLYIGKIFEQVKQRPLYVVSDQVVNGVER